MKITTAALCLSSAVAGGALSINSQGIDPFTPTYNSHFPWDAGQTPAHVSTADFDQDGYDDILVRYTVGGNSALRIYLNQSGTGFILSGILTNNNFGYGSGYANTADVNGDGYPDIILTGQPTGDDGSGDGVRVWFNQLAESEVCAADLDKTGCVDFSDLLFVLNEWGECGQQIN